MNRLASLAGATLIGLGALTAPAWPQDSSQPARETPAPHAAPKLHGGAPSEGMTGPGEADSKAEAERNSGAPAPAPGGCPLFNRKLELIV